MSDLDERLRSALSDLGSAAERQVRPAGATSVPPAGRRRRRATRVATGALVLALAGGTAAGGWLVVAGPQVDRGERAAAPCAPLLAVASLPPAATQEQRGRVDEVLAGPEVTDVVFRSSTDAYDRFRDLYAEAPTADGQTNSWRFTVRCEDDFPALRARLEAASARVLRVCVAPCPTDPAHAPVRVTPSETTSR